MARTGRLNLHLDPATKEWLEDHTLRLRRQTGRHLCLADVIEHAVEVYRAEIAAGYAGWPLEHTHG